MLSDAVPTALAALLDAATHNPSMNAVRAAMGRSGKVHDNSGDDSGNHSGDIVDFCVPVNPYFPTPQLLERLQARLPDLLKHYPDGAQTHELHIAALIGVQAEHIVVANGSTEIITTLCHAARGPLVTTVPTFGRWTDLPLQCGTTLHTVPHRRSQGWRIDVDELIDEARRTQSTSLVLCNPNNPTGAWFSERDIERLVGELTHLRSIVIDESFIDFSGLRSASELAAASGNVIVVKSMGKSLGWHGIRLGYAVAGRNTAAELRERLPWWNVNGVAAFVLKELAQCSTTRAAHAASFELIARDRTYLRQRLQQVPGLTVYPSRANFLYVELPAGVCGKALRVELLAKHGLFVRECSNKLGSSESFLRIAVLPAAEADRLAGALQSLLPTLRHAALHQARGGLAAV